MKHTNHDTWRRKGLALFLAFLLPLPLAVAQETEGEGTTEEEEIIELSEFEVTTDRDYRYRRTSSITATRLAADVFDMPLTIQILSEEFVNDLNLDRGQKAFRYISGAYVKEDLRTDSYGTDWSLRGFRTNNIFRNGINIGGLTQFANVDRVEVVKGPVTVFYGEVRPGGIVNVVTKKPQLRNSHVVDLKVGSWNYFNAKIDSQVKVGDHVGVRVIGSKLISDDWQDFLENDVFYISPAVRFKTNRFDITFEYERWEVDSPGSRSAYFLDERWFQDYANPPAESIAHFQAKGFTDSDFGNIARFYPDGARTFARGEATDEETSRYLKARWNRSMPTWRNDRFAFSGEFPFLFFARGNKDDIFPQIRPDLKDPWTFNPNGIGAFDIRNRNTFFADSSFKLTDWAELRYAFFYGEENRKRQWNAWAWTNADLTIPYRHFANVSWTEHTNHEVDLVWNLDLPWVKNKFLFGFEYDETRSRPGSLDRDYSRVAPVQAVRGQYAGLTLTGQNAVDFHDPINHEPVNARLVWSPDKFTMGDWRDPRWTKHIYGSHRGSFLPGGDFEGGRFHTMVGVRHSWRQDGRKGTVPMYGANFEVTPDITLFFSRGEVWQPNGRICDDRAPATPVGCSEAELEDLPPETGLGWDFGLKTKWKDDTITGTINFFKLDRLGIRREDEDLTRNDSRNLDHFANLPGSVQEVTLYRGSGQEGAEGIEVEMVWTPRRNFQTMIGYSWIWEAKIKTPPFTGVNLTPIQIDNNETLLNRRLRMTPEHMFHIWSKYTFTEGKLKDLSIGFGLRAKTEMQFIAQSPAADAILSGYTALDARVGYETKLFGRRTDLSLSVDNLNDTRYLSGWGQMRRTFYFTFRMYFDPAR